MPTSRNVTPTSAPTRPARHPRSAALKWMAAVALVSILFRILLPASVIEEWYSRGAFIGIRTVIDNTLAKLPFPLFYVFFICIIVLIIKWLIDFRRQKNHFRAFEKNKRLVSKLKWIASHVGLLLLTLVTLFLWVWGFNYGRVSVEDGIGFTVHEPSLEELSDEVYNTAAALAALRAEITKDTLALTAADFPNDLETAVRPLVHGALLRHGYPAPGQPRARQLLPKGILLRLGTAGVYWPWAAEGNIDAGLHPLQKPAVMAHELAHAYGFGDEGTCTFWAYLAGQEAESPVLRYAMELSYWRQIAGNLRYADPEGYLKWRENELDRGIVNDLQAIYDNSDQYQDIAPVLRDATYTAYLKAQGIHEGLLNYGRVVQLVEGYRRSAASRLTGAVPYDSSARSAHLGPGE